MRIQGKMIPKKILKSMETTMANKEVDEVYKGGLRMEEAMTIFMKAKKTDENRAVHISCFLPGLPFEFLSNNLPHIYVSSIHDACHQDGGLNGNMSCVLGGNDTSTYKIKPHLCFKFEIMQVMLREGRATLREQWANVRATPMALGHTVRTINNQ
ncbi:hypothetical protein HAX54_026484 [Datura stramonium]|uniref:Uncharacterized protein n=1 Tax=Datura stramonium TaxID=4076 RepID=A0ABS8V3U8_DATST|nr:hypothetical protein [Datura stramonium]